MTETERPRVSHPALRSPSQSASVTEAISLQIYCDSQEQIDYYWSKLGDGGEPRA